MSADISDVIEQRKAELSRLKRGNAKIYSRVLGKTQTPSAGFPRTPRTEDKMKQVLDTWSHYRQMRASGQGLSARRSGGARARLDLSEPGDGSQLDGVAPPPPPQQQQQEQEEDTSPASPWRRHLQLLHEAKTAARTAKENEVRATSMLQGLEERFVTVQHDAELKGAEITQLQGLIGTLNGQVAELVEGFRLKEQQSDVQQETLRLELVSAKRQLEVGQQTLELQQRLLSDTKHELALSRTRQQPVPVQLVAAEQSAWNRFVMCTACWACLTLLVYAYGFAGNCDCLRSNSVWWRTTY